MSKTKKRKTIAEVVEEKINNSVGVMWDKPWNHGKTLLNHFTAHEYKGVNRLILDDGEYATFLQIKRAGHKLQKGSKGVSIFQYTPYSKTVKDENGVEEEVMRNYFKLITVFDVAMAGLEYKHNQYENNEWEDDNLIMAKINELVNNLGVEVKYVDGSAKAYYSPSTDTITMPAKEQFKSKEGFYSTLLHEIGHSTGHPNRLNRFEYSRFGDQAYSREELVAEIFAFGIMRDFGLENFESEEQSAVYLKGWKENLKDNADVLVKAARSAESAFKLFYGISEVIVNDDEFIKTGEERRVA